MPSVGDLVLHVERSALTEFLAGQAKHQEEVKPRLIFTLSHELAAVEKGPAKHDTLTVHRTLFVPLQEESATVDTGSFEIRIPLRKLEINYQAVLQVTLSAATTTAFGQYSVINVGCGSRTIYELLNADGKPISFDLESQSGRAAYHSGHKFYEKGTLTLESFHLDLPDRASFVGKDSRPLSHPKVQEEIRAACTRVTEEGFYATWEESVTADSADRPYNTPNYALPTVAGGLLIPSAIALDREPEAEEYMPTRKFYEGVLESALFDYNLTESKYVEIVEIGPEGEEYTRAVEATVRMLSTSTTSVAYLNDYTNRQSTVFRPSSRYTPPYSAALEYDSSSGTHHHTAEYMAVHQREAVPMGRHYGMPFDGLGEETDTLSSTNVFNSNAGRDCEDGAFTIRLLAKMLTTQVEKHGWTGGLAAAAKVIAQYYFVITRNRCAGDVCHILLLLVPRSKWLRGLIKGCEVALASSAHKGEDYRLKALKKRAEDILNGENQMASQKLPMCAAESTSVATPLLTPASANKEKFKRILRLEKLRKELGGGLADDWMINAQSANLDAQKRPNALEEVFLERPDDVPLYQFYRNVTSASVSRWDDYQEDADLLADVFIGEDYGEHVNDYLMEPDKGDNRFLYGARMQVIANEDNLVLVPAMFIEKEDADLLRSAVMADYPLVFRGGEKASDALAVDPAPLQDWFHMGRVIPEKFTFRRTLFERFFAPTQSDVAKLGGRVSTFKFYVNEEYFKTANIKAFAHWLQANERKGVRFRYWIVTYGNHWQQGVRGEGEEKFFNRIYMIRAYFAE